jgi:hypothetical protein
MIERSGIRQNEWKTGRVGAEADGRGLKIRVDDVAFIFALMDLQNYQTGHIKRAYFRHGTCTREGKS